MHTVFVSMTLRQKMAHYVAAGQALREELMKEREELEERLAEIKVALAALPSPNALNRERRLVNPGELAVTQVILLLLEHANHSVDALVLTLRHLVPARTVNQSTVRTYVNRLRERGFVEETHDFGDDLYTLTAKGEAEVREMGVSVALPTPGEIQGDDFGGDFGDEDIPF